MESLCENCILYGFCNGRCGDTDPLMNTATAPAVATENVTTATITDAKIIR